MMAGLRALPKDPYEAAAIDGASPIQAFFKLTLPMLTKIIAIAVLIRGVDLFRTFDYIKVMTEGGPGTATETLTAYAGTIYFKNADFPYASTIALFTADPGGRHLQRFHQDLQGEVLMQGSLFTRILRDVTAVLVVAIFMFPMFWWGLTSIKPISAIFNKDEVVFFDFAADAGELPGGPARQVARRAGDRVRQHLRRRRRQHLRFPPDHPRIRSWSRSARRRSPSSSA